MREEPRIKVYYNSACPVCNAGISSQKKKPASCEVVWADVHLDNELVTDINADLEFVRERLHVIDENGDLQVGYNAFIAIWRNSESERWKAKVSSIPGIRQILTLGYNIFARLLYKWNTAKDHW